MIRIYQNLLMKAAQIDEFGADLGGAACFLVAGGCLGAPHTVPQPCPAMPQQGAREEFPPPDVVWPEHVLPARFGLPQKFRQRGRALEIFAYESPPDVIWPVPRGDFCPRIPSRRDLACGCPGQERQDFPHFPTKSPPNSSKDPNLSKKFDENGADLGGAACWGVPGGAPAMPQQGAPPIYA
ncbi:hypothetical protein MTR_0055s0100 [Medicago truncatula]|uniref:Uncharacterized protein n=1 Tax=Medicago truncatula TaxID=3880 RepID=A0A072THW2_MEDTR|nr:hypothetical protein MTR_0055s0100 [Medicago truncatula]